jgi:hypothetical protein
MFFCYHNSNYEYLDVFVGKNTALNNFLLIIEKPGVCYVLYSKTH